MKNYRLHRVLILSIIWAICTGTTCARDMRGDDGLFYHLNESTRTAEVISPRYYEASTDDEEYALLEDMIWNKYHRMTDVKIPLQVTFDSITYSVTSIGIETFASCHYLTSVTIPNTVSEIGALAFERCSNLQSIQIPESITTIDWATFYGCDGLVAVVIPEGVTSIGPRAFASCMNLTSIILPSSLIEIEDNAFCGCDRLTSITSLAERPPFLGSCCFDDIEEHSVFCREEYAPQDTLYVPKRSVRAYKRVKEWRLFKVIRPLGTD